MQLVLCALSAFYEAIVFLLIETQKIIWFLVKIMIDLGIINI